ncbi:hypothetical protein A9P82_10820 [Arachidicoccus ginsenosidimutans]|uniref:hypothetical protein n=1 Tax=Arachidicoccus sp. BS20 TaxID=1850526 RepID=UPI0007F09C86|nr:hypothetical protein [Arachidicoccus sp. BS20]ANI89739.1 hypothetical protein A9P82_10820 [Arachidicoccus sp. BS20]
MLGYFILGLILYFVFRFIVGFILPIWKSTKTVRENIRNMQDNQQQTETRTTTDNHKTANTSSTAGEYIDFEEIKDK